MDEILAFTMKGLLWILVVVAIAMGLIIRKTIKDEKKKRGRK